MAVKNGAYSLEEKREAVAYFNNNEVPKQIEQLLNKMFKEKPSDIFGYMVCKGCLCPFIFLLGKVLRTVSMHTMTFIAVQGAL